MIFSLVHDLLAPFPLILPTCTTLTTLVGSFVNRINCITFCYRYGILTCISCILIVTILQIRCLTFAKTCEYRLKNSGTSPRVRTLELAVTDTLEMARVTQAWSRSTHSANHSSSMFSETEFTRDSIEALNIYKVAIAVQVQLPYWMTFELSSQAGMHSRASIV